MDQQPGSTTEYFRGWVGQGDENKFVTMQILMKEALESIPDGDSNTWTGSGVVQP